MRATALGLINDTFLKEADVREVFYSRLHGKALERYFEKLQTYDVDNLYMRGEKTVTAKETLSAIRDKTLDDDQLQQAVQVTKLSSVRKVRVRHALIDALVDLDEHARDLVRTSDSIPARLITSHLDAYNRWDRLVAEAEFRKGVSVPLLLSPVLLVPLANVNWILGCLPGAFAIASFLKVYPSSERQTYSLATSWKQASLLR